MYRILIGIKSKERERRLPLDNDSPYSVLEKNLFESICTIDGITDCEKCLRGGEQVDWGSWEFVGNKRELKALFKRCRWDFNELCEELEDDKDYGVVFIEEAW